jgi:hypothetical protein
MPADTPLYFDTAHTKAKASGARYRAYSQAKTVAEYYRLNPDPAFRSKDFLYDFKHGFLHLTVQSAMMSLSLADRAVIGCVRGLGDVGAGGMPLQGILTVLSVHANEEYIRLESMASAPSPYGSDDPHDMSLGSRDHLHEQAQRLAEFSAPLRQAATFQGIDGGSDSPPQVGGGPIDSYTALGVSITRKCEFGGGSPSAIVWDRDLSPADPDPDDG